MAIYLFDTDNIYFPKTKEYFNEVMSSYANGNYRSAIVMLYTITICDLLFKLQELKDMYNDTIADEILSKIEKCKNPNDNKSKSKWEKELVDEIYNRTEILDLESYTNINHLYDHRNFAAHPALNENYELISPTQETTIAHIKNILTTVLVKPPIFIKNVVDMITEDLKLKKEVYNAEYEQLKRYLNNKYLERMPSLMLKQTYKAFWKICFKIKDNADCDNNRLINRKALQIIYDKSTEELKNYMKTEKFFGEVICDDNCIKQLIIFLSKYPELYSIMNDDAKLLINSMIKKDNTSYLISWFVSSNKEEHIQKLMDNISLVISLSSDEMVYMKKEYEKEGYKIQLLDFFVCFFRNSYSFVCADNRYSSVILPYLDEFSREQIIKIIEAINENNQIYDSWKTYDSNCCLINFAKDILGSDFDYSQYHNLKFDKEIIKTNIPEEPIIFEDDSLPF